MSREHAYWCRNEEWVSACCVVIRPIGEVAQNEYATNNESGSMSIHVSVTVTHTAGNKSGLTAVSIMSVILFESTIDVNES